MIKVSLITPSSRGKNETPISADDFFRTLWFAAVRTATKVREMKPSTETYESAGQPAEITLISPDRQHK